MAAGGVGSSVGGAAGDNGSGGSGWGPGWLSERGGTVTIGFDRADNGSSNNKGGPTGPNGNGGGNRGSSDGTASTGDISQLNDAQLAQRIADAQKAKGKSYGNQVFAASQQAIIDAATAEQQRRAQPAQAAQAAQRQAQIAQENTARTNLQNQINQATSAAGLAGLKSQLDNLGGMDPNSGALNQAIRDAYQGMTERLGEREQRAGLAGKLAGATSYNNVQALRQQIAGLGTKDATAEQNAAMLAGLDKQAAQFNEAETTAAVAGAQHSTAAPIGQAVGSTVSAARQAANTAEANRMGGYDDRSTADKLGDVAKAAFSGAGLAGAPGAVIGASAEAYNSFISNSRQAGSSTQTGNMDASRPSAGNALAGMTTGALKGAGYGSVLGPAGALAGLALGAIWGGASAAGVAPTAESLTGSSPLQDGQVTNVGSVGPAQQLVNGAWVGTGNGGRDHPTKPVNVGGGTTTGSPNVSTPTTPTGPTVTPPTGTPTTPTAPDGANKAGNSAFNNYLSELRKRQLNNLLSTGAGYSGTSGTALLGRVGAAQGAVGGMTGYVQSSLGGGKSLLGGAWSW